MNLLEYQAKQALKNSGLSVPAGRLVDQDYSFDKPIVLKVQVPTGNRGKNGGVVKVVDAEGFAREFSRLKDLDIKGHISQGVLAEELVEFDTEHYLSLLVDRDAEAIRLLARVNGGVDVEEAEDTVFSEVVSLDNLDDVSKLLCRFYNKTKSMEPVFLDFLGRALECLASNDALLLEINPLVVVGEELMALDCKMEIDDNALFRHPDLSSSRSDANFVILDENGNTAVVANGAGLSMATVDQVNQAGLKATNFLDIGGGANTEAITEQFKRLVELSKLEAIIVNIFAGITRCDQVASAIVAARNSIDDLPPIFIRLHGTNYDEAKKILDEASIGLYKSLSDCIKAAQNA